MFEKIFNLSNNELSTVRKNSETHLARTVKTEATQPVRQYGYAGIPYRLD